MKPHTPISRRLFVSFAALASLFLAFPALPVLGQATTTRETAVRAQLAQLTDSIERAVLSGEVDAYLWHIDTTDAVFTQEQKNWAADLRKRAPETFEITLSDDELTLDERTALVEINMTWNMPDAKRRRITYDARFTQSPDDPTLWKYAGENWQHVLGDHMVAMYLEQPTKQTETDDANHANIVVQVWPDVYASVNDRFGVTKDQAMNEPAQQVKLYRSMAHLQASIFLSYADVHGPLGGWNEPGEAVKALARGRPSPNRLRTLLAHEYGHVRTFLMGPDATTMPWWLLEGLAEFASEPFAQTRRQSESAIARYASTNTLAPWDAIADFENTPDQFGYHVYRQGHHMVMYVTDTFGDEKRTAWATRIANGQTLDQATQETLGISFQQLDENWRKAIANDGS